MPWTEKDAPITEEACQRLRGYVDGYEGLCWCGFDSEDSNDQQDTLDHIVHSLVDDWRGLLAVAGVIPSAVTEGGAQ